jgi:DnaJ-domain-containing protein 1
VVLRYIQSMRIPGRLRSSTLGDILGTAHRESACGAVELVESSGRTHRVHLLRGLVTSVEVDRASPSLAEMLRRDDVLGEDVIRRSLLRALSSRRLHGEVLVEEFRISPSVVDLALRKQIQNRLHLLENLTDAQVHFRVTVRPPRGSMQEKPLLAPEFLHGRKRARDREVWSSSDRPGDRVRTAQNDAARAHALRVLGLSGNESVDEVKRVYRKLAVTLHPDAHASASLEQQQEYSTKFQEVVRAYQALVA